MMTNATILARLRQIRKQMATHFYTSGLYSMKDLITDLETDIKKEEKVLASPSGEQLELFPPTEEGHTKP